MSSVDDLALPSSGIATRLARARVVGFLGDADPRVVEVAELLTSELVANAVLHGVGPITLHLAADETHLRVEVADGSTHLPGIVDAPREVGGLGLPIVDHLSRAWGADATPSGKTVWFELALDDG